MENLTDYTAAYLLTSTPIFSRGTYALYAAVNLSSILYDGKAVADAEVNACVDLLVCRGSTVAAGIICNPDTAHLFTTYLPMVPCVKLRMDDNYLPFEIDSSGFPLPSEESLKLLFSQLLGKLRGSNSPASQGQYLLSAGHCTLSPVPITLAAASFKLPIGALLELLSKNSMVDCHGRPTAYGIACGLLLRWRTDSAGCASPELATTVSGIKALRSALEWKPVRKKRRSLSERIARLNSPEPTDGAYAVRELQELLATPLDILFRDYPALRKKLMQALERSDTYLHSGSFSPASTVKRTTYRECLARICALWQQIGSDPWLDDSRQAKIRKTCETLLLQLASLFQLPADSAPEPLACSKKYCLHDRIRRYRPNCSHAFAIINMPLLHYYYAAACLAQSDYPNWLYRREIQPLLTEGSAPETAFDLKALSQYCYNLHEHPNVSDSEETFPLLYNLLVEPIIRPTIKTENEV